MMVVILEAATTLATQHVILNISQLKILFITMTIDLGINLIASFIALIIGLFWKDRFVPWLRSILYRGIIIKGKWRIIQDELTVDGKEVAIKRETYVDLNQYADALSGTATSIATHQDGNQDFIVYDVRGEIKDRFVSIRLVTMILFVIVPLGTTLR
jgi:hypothetical protein